MKYIPFKPTSMWKAVKIKEIDAYTKGLRDAKRVFNRFKDITASNVAITTLIQEAYDVIRN